MLWVTRCHARIDRVACPWLITRFVDQQAKFIFGSRQAVSMMAAEGAIPFDMPDVELGHGDGRCSFESIMFKYKLDDLALKRLAKIVHAADISDDIDLDPIARGLNAIATGFHLRYPADDENLGAQFGVYDALYAWCRLDVAKQD